MSRAAQVEPWATLDDVERVTGFARTKATEIMRAQLGAFKPSGSNKWRCTWKALRAYKKAQEQGGSTWHPNEFRSSTDEATGTVTSERRTADDYSARSTSETTAAPQASAQQQLRTGKSKAAQRLASRLDAAKRARSGQHSKRSPKPKR